MSYNDQEKFDGTIIIDDSLGESITISARGQYLDDNHIHKLSPNGKVIISIPKDINDETSREVLISELLKLGFENIPEELNEEELKDIIGFAISKMDKEASYGQIYPFIVKKCENDDLSIILLMNNKNTFPFELAQLPITLKDAEEKVVFADFVKLNKAICAEKTGIYYIKVNKEDVKEKDMDLSTWSIIFQV
ncbi:SLAP domain-containing protein [Clostridium sp. OS1-26]|uniref:SLAP domain-containing protein n=1 Tax=Clostridium sp. OS1-26 TaxID=3070681 RepID=UPI0027DEE9A9|nr:SLAP domain-containing protein [Clostridium sp. OS1-26]WML36735.1 SLAP domain-containing protein [Clostridium sp. OS1-26]